MRVCSRGFCGVSDRAVAGLARALAPTDRCSPLTDGFFAECARHRCGTKPFRRADETMLKSARATRRTRSCRPSRKAMANAVERIVDTYVQRPPGARRSQDVPAKISDPPEGSGEFQFQFADRSDRRGNCCDRGRARSANQAISASKPRREQATGLGPPAPDSLAEARPHTGSPRPNPHQRPRRLSKAPESWQVAFPARRW
jgi:hypothetical protein